MSSESTPASDFEIAHVLFIDIVDYTRRLSDEQRGLVEELNRIVRGSEQFQRAETAGKLTRLPTGDGMALAFFGSPETPVRCALEISAALQRCPGLKVRMGIHSGPVSGVTDVNERSNVAGAGINVAQRVMDCGDAGHILLSKRIADDLGHYGRWRPQLHDLGEVEVKHGLKIGIVNLYAEGLGNPESPEKVRQLKLATVTGKDGFSRLGKRRPLTTAFLVAIPLTVGLGVLFQRAALPWGRAQRTVRLQPAALTAESRWALGRKSIAVLPFENLSEDQGNSYFAAGLQDEIITRLAKIGDLKVISRSSTQRYKDRQEDLPELARQLGVAHIVEGSVQKIGDRVRINVQLIRTDSNDHLWAEIYDRKVTDILTVEGELTAAIANVLQAKLTGREQETLTQKPTNNFDAYDLYLQGIDYATRPGEDPQDRAAAAGFFAEAVRLDPGFALAWARLSQVNAWLLFLQFDVSPVRRETARVAAETATELNPSAPETLFAAAYYRYHVERDYEGARILFDKIQREVPGSSKALEALGYIARRQSRWTESIRLFAEAAQLNPRDAHLSMERSWTFTMLRQFPSALEMVDRALVILPDDPDLLASKAEIFQMQGDLPAAESVLARLDALPVTELVVAIRFNQALLQRRYEEAVRLLEKRLAVTKPTLNAAVNRVSLGWARALAGDQAGAKEAYLQARNELDNLQREQVTNSSIVSALAAAEAGLGNKEAALREGERSVALLPATQDPLLGPRLEQWLARIEVQVGQFERALDRIERLLAIPYREPITQATLRLDPAWDLLRDQPRFQKLLSNPELPTNHR